MGKMRKNEKQLFFKAELCFSESELRRMQALCAAEGYRVEAFIAASAIQRLEASEKVRAEVTEDERKHGAAS